jgi:hypothetical protein
MRADADEAVRRFATESFVIPTHKLVQGIARVLSGDLDGGDASLEDAASIAEQVGAPEDLVLALCERALVAITRGEWDRAEVLSGQAHTALRRARREESYVTPLVCAAQARVALHRADLPAVRQHLVTAQRLRPELTYALPHFALQARIELTRVYLALADLAGARTLMREIDELLRRRPGMGNLAGQAEALRAQLSTQRGPAGPGLGPDRGRAAPAAAAVHAPVAAGDRPRAVLVPQHDQVRGELDLPQARGLLPQPGRQPVPRAGAPGGLTVGSSCHQGSCRPILFRWLGSRRAPVSLVPPARRPDQSYIIPERGRHAGRGGTTRPSPVTGAMASSTSAISSSVAPAASARPALHSRHTAEDPMATHAPT